MVLVDPRRTLTRVGVAVACILALVAAVTLSLLVGSNRMPIETVLGALFGGLESPDATVVTTQRLPRTAFGIVVGLALGAAGALMQGHTRNVLAEPGLFGVNAGAALGVVTVAYALDLTGAMPITFAALVGAGVATAIVVAVAWSSSSRGAPVTLALVGAGLGAVLSSATTTVVLADRQSLDVMRQWAVGSLVQRPIEALPFVAVIVAVGLVLALVNAPGVTALGLGSDVARTLGNRVGLIRIVGLVAITLLAGAATAACGPIAFVGLVAPTLVRRFTGPAYGWLVPLAAVAGAALVLVADSLGRVVLPTGELPVGVMLAILGAPVLVGVVTRRSIAL